MNPKYSIVIPVYNEAEVLHETWQRLRGIIDSLDELSEIIFINDGSSDDSASIIQEMRRSDPRIRRLDFTRNFGHQIAISAGIDNARGKAVILMDADLQDPPEIIPEMIQAWENGYEVVYGRRISRQGETLFKRITAFVYSRLLRFLTEVDIPLDVGDFCLLDRQVCDVLKGMREQKRFVRGLVSWVGFRQTTVDYIREARPAGKSKYSLHRMLNLALDGVVSFSPKPLRAAALLGTILCLLGILFVTATGTGWLDTGATPAGNLFIGFLTVCNGLLFVMMGALGEYIARIGDETRQRPLYITHEPRDMIEENRTNERRLARCSLIP